MGEMKQDSPKIGAFFDFDKTLLDTNSARLGFQYLWERRELPPWYAARLLFLNIFYKAHFISEEAMSRQALSLYKNKRLEYFESGAWDFFHRFIRPHLAPNLLEKLAWHQGEGHATVLLSGSLEYYLTPVFEELGFDFLVCSRLEKGPDGRLTGQPQGLLCIDANKKTLAVELAREQGIDLARSYGYGNHQADIPLLESVGHAFVVEPTLPLRRVARQRGWPEMTFR